MLGNVEYIRPNDEKYSSGAIRTLLGAFLGKLGVGPDEMPDELRIFKSDGGTHVFLLLYESHKRNDHNGNYADVACPLTGNCIKLKAEFPSPNRRTHGIFLLEDGEDSFSRHFSADPEDVGSQLPLFPDFYIEQLARNAKIYGNPFHCVGAVCAAPTKGNLFTPSWEALEKSELPEE